MKNEKDTMTPEEKLSLDQKVKNFTACLHKAAEKNGCVFFEDSGEGHELETETMFLEDVSGWLAPIGTLEENARIDANYRFAEWQMGDSGEIESHFKVYPKY